MALGTAHITGTTAASFLPDLWSKELQIATESNLVAARLIKRFDAEVKRSGVTLEIPKISNMVATSKSASTQVTFQTFTETKITLTLNKHYESSFIIEDIVDAQTAYNIAEEYKHKGVYALAKQVDTDILALQTSVTQSVGTAGVDLQDANFLRGVQYLDDADAPDTERFFIMSPKVKASFLQIDKYVNQDFSGLGDVPVKTGLFGQRYGVPFFVSTNVPVDASSNPINLLGHKEVYCAGIQKDIELRTDYIIEYLAQAYVCQVLYGVIVYRAPFGVKMLA